jgi:molybdopterin-binding protein
MTLSARNQLKGTVEEIQLGGVMAHVVVRVGENLIASVVTPKPANGGQGKTGQREEAGDSVVLSCRLLWRQVYFRTPTPRTTFEYMTVMEKTIEHGGDGGAISQ